MRIPFKNSLLSVLKITVFVVLVIYSMVSIKYIFNWFNNYNNLQVNLQNLKQQQQDLQNNIQKLTIKVNGLKEESINLDILETQAKTILQLKHKQEKVFIK